MADSERKSFEDVHYKQIRNQVFQLAKTILSMTKDVEEALLNIKTISTMLNRISNKLESQKHLCDDERKLLQLAEQWLSQHSQTISNNCKLEKFVGAEKQLLTGISQDGNSRRSSVISTSTNCINADNGDLDWDGAGVHLWDSFHSNTYRDPYANLSLLSFSEKVVDIKKTDSYDGFYEEEMETTLELEEGFYSDSSQSVSGESKFDENKSHQSDSGIAHSDITSAEISPYKNEDFFSEGNTIYNSEINTWNFFATVNLDDDSISTASNSNVSTPQFKRRTNNNCESRLKGMDIKCTERLVLTTTLKHEVNQLKDTQKNQDSKNMSLPDLTLSKLNETFYHHNKETTKLLEHGRSNLSTSDHNITSTKTENPVDGYIMTSPIIYGSRSTPNCLHRNNYYRKTRKAVFV